MNQKKHLSWLELLVVLLDWNLMGLQVWEKEKFLSEKEKRTIANLACKTAGFVPMYKKVQTFLPLFNEEEHQERREG